MSTTFVLSYALSFGSLSAVLVRSVLNLYAPQDTEEDNHFQAYQIDDEVPDLWYWTLFVVMIVLSIFVCEAWETRLPSWGFLLTKLIPFVFMLPVGIVRAMTSVTIGT